MDEDRFVAVTVGEGVRVRVEVIARVLIFSRGFAGGAERPLAAVVLHGEVRAFEQVRIHAALDGVVGGNQVQVEDGGRGVRHVEVDRHEGVIRALVRGREGHRERERRRASGRDGVHRAIHRRLSTVVEGEHVEVRAGRMLDGAGEEGILRNGGGVNPWCGRILDGHQLGGLLLVAAGIGGQERAGHLPRLRAGSLNAVHGEERDGDRSTAVIEGGGQVRRQGRITLDRHRARHEVEFRRSGVDEGHRLARRAGIAAGIRGFEVTGHGVLAGASAGQGVRHQLHDVDHRVTGVGIGRQVDRERRAALQGH